MQFTDLEYPLFTNVANALIDRMDLNLTMKKLFS